MPKGTVEFKEFNIELKKITEEGDFEGYLSTFGNIDAGGDRVWAGAYRKTLREKKKFPILWQHSWMTPLGSFTGKEDTKGLFINGHLNLMTTVNGTPKIPKAHEAHALMLNGDIDGLSIGYDALVYDEERVKNQTIRNLRELRLWEGSVVTFPMNEEATITTVKAIHLMQDIQKSIEDGSLTKEQVLEWFETNEPTTAVTHELEQIIGKTRDDIELSMLLREIEKIRKEVFQYGN